MCIKHELQHDLIMQTSNARAVMPEHATVDQIIFEPSELCILYMLMFTVWAQLFKANDIVS